MSYPASHSGGGRAQQYGMEGVCFGRRVVIYKVAHNPLTSCFYNRVKIGVGAYNIGKR